MRTSPLLAAAVLAAPGFPLAGTFPPGAGGPPALPAALQEPARPPERPWEEGVRDFRQLLRGPAPERLQAPGALAATGDPRAIELLVGLIGTIRGRELDLLGRLQLQGRKLNELYERFKIMDPTGRIRPGLRQARPPEVLKAEAERERLEKELGGERALLGAGIEAIAALFTKHLRGETADRASEALVERASERAPAAVRLPYVDALAGVPAARAVSTLTHLAEKEPDPEIRAGALGALRAHAEGEAGAAVLPVLIGRLGDPSWQVKVAAVEALRALRERSAVPALIEMLGRDPGRLQEDALEALRELSGQDLGPNPVVWREWWERSAAGNAAPPAPPAGAAARGGTSFYGIETLSERILFVLDKSNSMNEPAGDPRFTGAPAGGQTKIQVAREELLHALTPLPERAAFNIVFYHHEVDGWRKGMVRASAENKQAARLFVASVVAEGNTNIFDAIEKAFSIAGRGSFDRPYDVTVDTIFLLTDGKPNRGRLVEPAAILEEVRRLNALRRIKIHCVGIGDHDAAFMETLARENGGRYVSRR